VPTIPTHFNIVLEFLGRAIRHEEEIKGIQIGKKKKTVKISLFKDPKKLYPKTPRHCKQVQQDDRIQNQLKTSLRFLYTNNEQTEKEYIQTIPFTIASKKNQISRSKLNKGCE
jgi:hypothetical protein